MKISFSPEAEVDLKKLDKEVQFQVVKKLRTIAGSKNPKRYLHPLKELGAWKIRVGDYRILVDLKGDTLWIHLIGHRKKVYKKIK
jgi:mRNA-degrading endonuclease RelE of RelBE toxin-antitoxin system